MTKIEKVPVDFVECHARHRAINTAKLGPLQESISAIGLQTPISVWLDEDDDGNQRVHLVAGRHRLEVARLLGWEEIDAIYVEMNETDRELWEIDENLCRSELTEAEEAQHLARRKQLWEAKEKSIGSTCTDTRVSSRGRKNEGRPDGFAASTAKVTGDSKTTINRKIARAEKIEPEILEQVKGTDLDKGVVLDELAKAPKEAQAAKIIEIRERQETDKLNRYADKAVARSNADEAAEIIHANLDLDQVDELMARLASVSMKDFIAALAHRRAA